MNRLYNNDFVSLKNLKKVTHRNSAHGLVVGFLCSLSLINCSNQSQIKPKKDLSTQLYEAWDYKNNPLLLSNQYQLNFAKLPLAGDLSAKQVPWADTYWPTHLGGISYRWNASQKFPFEEQLYPASALAQFSQNQMAVLSPAEKYDIFMGRYDYPLTQSELRRTDPNAPQWTGLCHGWAAAAAQFKEPEPIVVKNRDGIVVPFGSSDIKALVTLYQGEFSPAKMRFLGLRCQRDPVDIEGIRQDPSCKGTNAGTFHLVLSNQISLLKQSFNADVSRSSEVWNHPVYAFQATVIGKRAPTWQAAPGTVEEVVIETKMRYTVEAAPQWQPFKERNKAFSKVALYRYSIELNAEGNIIGGQWLSFGRPDFLWIKDKANFSGYFSGLAQIFPNP